MRILTVSDAWRLAPDADALYACDKDWWHAHAAASAAAFGGQRWTQDFEAAIRWRLAWIRGVAAPGLSRDPRVIHTGGNSGYQAVNLAVLFGASAILLVGFDMKEGAGGRAHFFGDHPGHLRRFMNYAAWRAEFGPLSIDLKAAGVTVLNCTPESALTCFPRAELERALW